MKIDQKNTVEDYNSDLRECPSPGADKRSPVAARESNVRSWVTSCGR